MSLERRVDPAPPRNSNPTSSSSPSTPLSRCVPRSHLLCSATEPYLAELTATSLPPQDTEDPNPLIRALSIRTMGCLRAEKILDYIADPLRKCLRDENPYVRKTAALGVMKLYDMKPSLAIDNGFIEMLQEMVTDSNPMVRLLSPSRTASPSARRS